MNKKYNIKQKDHVYPLVRLRCDHGAPRESDRVAGPLQRGRRPHRAGGEARDRGVREEADGSVRGAQERGARERVGVAGSDARQGSFV